MQARLKASHLVLTCFALSAAASAQSSGPKRLEVSLATLHDVSRPLRANVLAANGSTALLNLLGLGYGFAGPQGSFTFQGSPGSPNGAAGLTQYVQLTNISFAVFDKATGNVVYGPALLSTLWSDFAGPCQTTNNGDPIMAYDKIANRWVISQVSASSGTGYFQCVAVSTSTDATGSYYRYAFPQPQWNDFAKLGVWPDAYYMSFDMFAGGTQFVGARACAFDRHAMLTGAAATEQCFQLTTADASLLPSDLDGSTPPPVGAPNHYLELDPAGGALRMWDFHADWADPAKSAFSGPVVITVAPFRAACGASKITDTGICIPQFQTKTQLDSMGDRLMHRLAYRNFGDHEAIVTNHSVAAGTSVGVRWYELRSLSGTPTVYQQGTYAPDGNYRWLGSIAMDRAGDIAFGYSISGLSSPPVFPGIRYTGRSAADALGTMQAETTIVEGSGPQTNTGRWGDYSAMSVDPVDDCTFWYTNQYMAVGGTTPWSSRIAAFRFPACLSDSVVISRIVDAAGYRAQPIAPDGLFTVLGANLATQATAAGQPDPNLGGSSVTITDASGVARLALLLYVSPSQINFLTPSGMAVGPGQIAIVNGAGRKGTITVQVNSVSPGLFAADQTGQGVAAAGVLRVSADGSRSTSSVATCDANTGNCKAVPIVLSKSTDQVYVSFYGTGIRGKSGLEATTLTIGGIPVQMLYLGAQSQYQGLDQIDVRLPSSLAGSGQSAVVLTVDGHPANIVDVTVQ